MGHNPAILDRVMKPKSNGPEQDVFAPTLTKMIDMRHKLGEVGGADRLGIL